MAIKVDRALLSRMKEDPGSIVIQVQDAPDPVMAADALERARGEIGALDGGWQSAYGLSPGDRNGPKSISPVMPAGSGPLVIIDGGGTPYELLRTIPDIVVRHLEAAGVDRARIATATKAGPMYEFAEAPRGVTLTLYPPAPHVHRQWAQAPLEWVEAAWDWASSGLQPDDTVWAAIVSTQFQLTVGGVVGFFEQCRRRRASRCHVMAGDPQTRVRSTGANFYSEAPNVIVGAGGPSTTDAELVELVEQLKDLARPFAADLGLAFISIHATCSGLLGGPDPMTEWDTWLGGEQSGSITPLCDEFVFDAYPWQILGPGHLARLGGRLPGARPLAGGRVELAIGDPLAWIVDPSESQCTDPRTRLFRSRDPDVPRSARELLSGCLPRRGDTSGLMAARYAEHQEE
ncbi:MAG TPA: hypothetical protein VNA57_10210 [Acidimicrobiales bacterium]|nr:hypothetical protein [Acidimicrobiales bacterium]